MLVIIQTLACGHTRTLPRPYHDHDEAERRAIHLTLIGPRGASYTVRFAT